ncbi:MAG: alpha-isopropylmalate synthase regulatory domain-containing protein, partial [Pseudomonadota bacterium]
GTLFGNGERTGNVDIVTLALNLYSQGVHPGLDCSDINELMRVVEYCNQLPVHPRHPYAGELVFTAFSGSHQDAINKGFQAMRRSNQAQWEVPYLPIDPADLGRSYEAVIRINSQSGKGGIAYVMEKDYGLIMPKRLQIEFSQAVQAIADRKGEELESHQIWACFTSEYLEDGQPFGYVSHRTEPHDNDADIRLLEAVITHDGEERTITGSGTGPIDAFVGAVNKVANVGLEVIDYREHAIGTGANAAAVAYVEAKNGDGQTTFGVSMHRNITSASLCAVLSAANRFVRAR